MEVTAQDVLDRAYIILREGGVAKGCMSASDGSHCALGAIGAAALEFQIHPSELVVADAIRRLQEVVNEISDEPRFITSWNDTSPEEVVLETVRRMTTPTLAAA